MVLPPVWQSAFRSVPAIDAWPCPQNLRSV